MAFNVADIPEGTVLHVLPAFEEKRIIPLLPTVIAVFVPVKAMSLKPLPTPAETCDHVYPASVVLRTTEDVPHARPVLPEKSMVFNEVIGIPEGKILIQFLPPSMVRLIKHGPEQDPTPACCPTAIPSLAFKKYTSLILPPKGLIVCH